MHHQPGSENVAVGKMTNIGKITHLLSEDLRVIKHVASACT